ncbi:TPA: Dot/Icm T4SS effector RavX [Legionella pneumophila]|nr:Dot/Icm T4SS effector RavX [Legionella pneumophila]HAU1391386.1 Dot/Icm T4SS effector RavX [Legionella pneumophila]HBD7417801.1 Dot/Icm T4SS effector RavX [Legionella pneumophila]HBD9398529.1 Dot/Icm T4SS effector RavX [Legionella pneumophila]
MLTISESSKEDLDVVPEHSEELDVSPSKETSKTNSKKLESTARKEQIKKLEGELYSHIQDAIELEEEESFAEFSIDTGKPSNYLFRFVSEKEYLAILENLNQGKRIFGNKKKVFEEEDEKISTKAKGETFFAFDLKYAQKYFNKGTRRNGAMLAIELHEDADSKLLSNTEIVRRIGDDPGMAGGRWAKCKKVKPGERGVVVAKCEGVRSGCKYPYTLGFREGEEGVSPFDILFDLIRSVKVLGNNGSCKTIYHCSVPAPKEKELTSIVKDAESGIDEIHSDEVLSVDSSSPTSRFGFFTKNELSGILRLVNKAPEHEILPTDDKTPLRH